jgi:hypothetical protein
MGGPPAPRMSTTLVWPVRKDREVIDLTGSDSDDASNLPPLPMSADEAKEDEPLCPYHAQILKNVGGSAEFTPLHWWCLRCVDCYPLFNHERTKRDADAISRPMTGALVKGPRFMIRIHQLGQADRNIRVNAGVRISAVIAAERKYLRACEIPNTWYRIGDWCVPDNDEAKCYPGLALRRVFLRPHQDCFGPHEHSPMPRQ